MVQARHPIVPVYHLGLALVVVSILAAAPKHAQADQAEEACTQIHGAWHQYLDRRKCIRERRKAEETRNCLAKDTERMESLATEIRNRIREHMPLADAQTVLQSVLERTLPIARAKDDAEDRVIETEITTHCASAFQLVIQVRAAPSGNLRHLKIWSKFPPESYPEGYRAKLSRDFEGDRRKRELEQRRRAARAANERTRKRLHAEAVKRRAQEAARLRREAEVARQRRLEDERKRRDRRDRERRQALAGPPPQKDHCAPSLAKQERIRRLHRFGTVRRVGRNQYRAGGREIGFAAKGRAVTFCR